MTNTDKPRRVAPLKEINTTRFDLAAIATTELTTRDWGEVVKAIKEIDATVDEAKYKKPSPLGLRMASFTGPHFSGSGGVSYVD